MEKPELEGGLGAALAGDNGGTYKKAELDTKAADERPTPVPSAAVTANEPDTQAATAAELLMTTASTHAAQELEATNSLSSPHHAAPVKPLQPSSNEARRGSDPLHEADDPLP